MTKASDNDFPSLLVTEQGSTPTTPAASHDRLFVRSSDHLLCLVNSSGTVTPVGAAASGSITSSGYTQNTAKMLGRTTASSGAIEEITVGTGLSLSAGSLTATGGSAGAMVFLEAHTASSSAQLDFTTFISSTYDTYLFEFVSLIFATDSAQFWMRMGTGGGPTYDTGNNYSHDNFVMRAGGTAFGGGSAQSKIVVDFPSDGVKNTTSTPIQGDLRLYDPQNASLFKQILSDITYVDAANFRVRTDSRGAYESTTAVTAVRFMASTGNITSGTIRAYGLTKS